jgi:hypothetical protein
VGAPFRQKRWRFEVTVADATTIIGPQFEPIRITDQLRFFALIHDPQALGIKAVNRE